MLSRRSRKLQSEAPSQTFLMEFSSAVLPFLAALLVAAVFLSLRSRKLSSHAPHLNTIKSVQQFLDPKGGDFHHDLHTRAVANERLFHTFGIQSTFVSGDKGVRDQFNKLCRVIMNESLEGGWTNFKNIANDAALLSVPDTEMRLDDYFGALGFITAAVGLMGADPSTIDVDVAARIATGVTTYWVYSKSDTPPKFPKELHDHIARMIPNRERYPNPIEIVLPTVEPFWRLIAAVYIHGYHNPALRQTLLAFYKNPTTAAYNHFDGKNPSVHFIMQEAIRLHPPICRISRADWALPFPFNLLPSFISSPLQGIIRPTKAFQAADIEAVQKSSEIWGENPLEFKPMRHAPETITSTQKEAIMAFGVGKMKCIARDWALIAVAIIAASALEALPNEKYELVEGKKIGRRMGWDGWYIKNKSNAPMGGLQQIGNLTTSPKNVPYEPPAPSLSLEAFTTAAFTPEDIQSFVKKAIDGESGLGYKINQPPVGRPARVYTDGM